MIFDRDRIDKFYVDIADIPGVAKSGWWRADHYNLQCPFGFISIHVVLATGILFTIDYVIILWFGKLREHIFFWFIQDEELDA